MKETKQASGSTLSPMVEIDGIDLTPEWRTSPAPPVHGAPFLALLDLPPLPAALQDERLLAAVGADPWTPMQVWGGPSPELLTLRGQVLQSATIARLAAATGPGPTGRWDRVNTILVAVEGASPASRTELAVLGGAGALAVETANGWEIVQYRQATLVPGGLWRLSGLLRGQQGTEAEMSAGLATGAMAVFLDDAPVRLAGQAGELNLPWVWRAGPQGGPTVGPGVSEVRATSAGVWARPWRPAHLTRRETAEGLALGWIGRSRLDVDGWGSGEISPDLERYRLRVFDGENIRRVFEVEGPFAVYLHADRAADFPGGVGPEARVGVAQAGVRGNWGVEAVIPLSG